MPILGIVASSISGSKVITGNYYSIQTATVDSGGASTITFSSIPSDYTHLQLRFIALGTGGSSYNTLQIRFNSDSGSNYRLNHTLLNASASTDGSGTRLLFYRIGDDGALTGAFGVGVIDLLDYTNTNKYKTARGLIGVDLNSGGQIGFNSGLWLSTSAISSIELQTNTGANFKQYSQFALYGIKA